MRIRGRRECRNCGEQWSYYATGEVACPTCGSMRSVGLDEERTLHTDAPVALDLSEARAAVGEQPLSEVADAAASAAREYLHARGFIDAGTLEPLDATVVAAADLRQVAGELARAARVDPDAESYFLTLLRGAPDGERPADVPDSLTASRGRAVADATRIYREDLRAYLDEHPDGPARTVLGRFRDQERRIRALDGDVPADEAEALLEGVRAVGEYLRTGDPEHLERARDRLTALP